MSDIDFDAIDQIDAATPAVEVPVVDGGVKIPSNSERLALLLNSLTFAELLDAKAAIIARIAEVAPQEKAKLLENAAMVANYFGTTPDALFPVSKKKKAVAKRTATVIKFRNPNDPSKTWTGRGKRPNWVTDEMKVAA